MSNKRGHRGEREVSRKTIARGMPGETGVTVVTMLVCFIYFAREAAGALGARHSPRPLFSERRNDFLHNSGKSRREIAESYVKLVAVIARSKATKQSILTSRRNGLKTRHTHSRHPRESGDPVFQRRP